MNAQSGVFEIARYGCVEDLQYVLKDYPEVINYKNASGFTPLTLACYNGNIEVATLLAKNVENI
ncbi:MAG: ankyrin repeat domain-containing protein, partial [Flavobacteriaceae bacterium]|nr:ankyrin repeat domain-containing protein [Flavobacteriaceae bacterium]